MKFGDDQGVTRLFERESYGPLIIQKPLYQEGPEVCQVVIVHPPGGVVGGDQLEITAQVGDSAIAQVTTPGAAKWYKANGYISRQKVKLEVGARGSVGVTQLKSVVVARYLGNSSEVARRVILGMWGLLRPAMLNRQAMVPRMWNT